MRPSRAELAVLGLLLVLAHSARGQAIGQGFDLERAGQYQRAAIVYFTTLRAEPTNLAALLGLERVGEWEGAAREWAAALGETPAQLPSAASSLAEAPAEQRERILRAVLAADPKPLVHRLAAELLLGWGQPERAWSVFAPTVAE